MDKATQTLVVVLAIGALIGFGGGYYYYQNAATTAYQQGLIEGQSIAPQAYYTTPAKLDFNWSASDDFDHTGTVDASGNVATDTEVNNDLTITNSGDTDASSIVITMTNPKTQAKGLDKDLDGAVDYINVYIDYGSLSKLYLVKEGVYQTAGRNLGELPSGSDITVTVHVEFLEHDGGNFPDAKTLDNEIYIWQPGADNVDVVDFTIST